MQNSVADQGLMSALIPIMSHLFLLFTSSHTTPYYSFSSTVLSMRGRCQEVEKENLVMRQELSSLRALHADAISRIHTLEAQAANAESANEALHRQLKDYTTLRSECEAVVSGGES